MTSRRAIGLLCDENTMTAGTVSIPPALMPDGGGQGEKSGASHHLFITLPQIVLRSPLMLFSGMGTD